MILPWARQGRRPGFEPLVSGTVRAATDKSNETLGVCVKLFGELREQEA